MFYIYWFVHTYWFLHVSNHVCSWSSLTKYVENAAARSGSGFKWEDRGGVVIWWKICWQVVLRGQLREIFVWKSRPSREIPLLRKGKGQAGRGYHEHASKKFLPQTIRLRHQSSNKMHCGAGRRTTVTLIIPQHKWLPRLIWGEQCSKIP